MPHMSAPVIGKLGFLSNIAGLAVPSLAVRGAQTLMDPVDAGIPSKYLWYHASPTGLVPRAAIHGMGLEIHPWRHGQ